MTMELADNHIYQNPHSVAILSVSRFDEDTCTGRRTHQFTPPPSQVANSQVSGYQQPTQQPTPIGWTSPLSAVAAGASRRSLSGGGDWPTSATAANRLPIAAAMLSQPANDRLRPLTIDDRPTTTAAAGSQQQRSLISSYRKRNGWYDFVIALLVVTCLCVVIGILVPTLRHSRSDTPDSLALQGNLTITTVSPLEQVPSGGKDPVLLNDILVGQLNPIRFNGSWHTNNTILFYDRHNNFRVFDVENGTSRVIIDNITYLRFHLSGDLLSRDGNYLLSPFNTRHLFRHSKLSNYKIFDIKRKKVLDLLPNASDPSDRRIQLAEWGPSGSQLVFVHNNNIYYKPSATAQARRLTESGVVNLVYNGLADWVYEEEILSDIKAFWLSPDGRHLAYVETNDTLVDSVSWPVYGDQHNASAYQYSETVSLRYPKPGRTNPTIRLFVTRLDDDGNDFWEVKPPDTIAKGDYYYSSVNWLDKENLLVIWLNRSQTFASFEVCSLNQACQTTFTIESVNGWVDVLGAPIPAPNLGSYLIRVPQQAQENGLYYQHVALINVTDGNIRYLTSGLFDVIEILSYDQATSRVYFLSSLPDHPEQRHLMWSSASPSLNATVCLTCNVSTSCQYNSAFFSRDSSYYVLNCQGPNVPVVQVRRAHDNRLMIRWEDNWKLRETLNTKRLPTVRRMRVNTTSEYYANVELWLPANFTEDRRYPVLFDVYAGPNSQTVTDSYKLKQWSTYLTGALGLIYVRVDGRGSANRGCKYLHEIYQKLGQVEVSDIIAVARHLRDKVKYVNPDLIAIWGWSYGGYATLLSLTNDYQDPVFSCGIAVAPITNWLFYDSVYVERYMDLPSVNPLAYNKSNVLDKVIYLKNKKLMLAFGSADDNVHAQHSMMLMKELNELGLVYDTQIYPDNDHSLSGDTNHLYTRMEGFLRRCYGQRK